MTQEDLSLWLEDITPQGLALFIKATAFAAERHRKQRRKDYDKSPYINHPIQVAQVLSEAGINDSHILAAALLHDTIEDTETTAEELRTEFGNFITTLVLELSSDEALDYAIRKARQIECAPLMSTPAKWIKLADRICNLRDILDWPPVGWSLERQQAYFDHSAKMLEALLGANPRLELQLQELLDRRSELSLMTKKLEEL